jgi:hypothetical protein
LSSKRVKPLKETQKINNMTGAKRCTKGKSCGATCIDPVESCVLELGQPISESTGKVVAILSALKDSNSSNTASSAIKKSSKTKKKKELKPESQEIRIPLFSHLKGKEVSTSALDLAADNWRKASGLALPPQDPGGGINKHDRVHVLFHEFLGGGGAAAQLRGRVAIGKWLGTHQTGPSVAEEIFVSRLHEAAQAKGEGKKHKLSDEELGKKIATDLKGLNELGMINSSELTRYYKGNQPDFDKFVKKYREFENSPNYETLLDAANVAFPNYPK